MAAEAEAVSEIAVKAVHKMPSTSASSQPDCRAVPPERWQTKICFVETLVRCRFDPVGRASQAFVRIIDQDPHAEETVRADGYLIIDVARAREHLAARGEVLWTGLDHPLRERLVGGEPVFKGKGMRVPVRTIAG
jgi:hypothetical protein